MTTLSNLTLTPTGPTTLDVSVDAVNPSGTLTVAARSTAPYTAADAAEIETGTSGLVSRVIDVSVDPGINTVPLTGLTKGQTMHIGAVVKYPPPVVPGDVLAPYAMSSAPASTSSLTLSWSAYENDGANANVKNYDFNSTEFPVDLRNNVEGAYWGGGNGGAVKNVAAYYPVITSEVTPRAGSNCLKFWVEPQMCRQELHVMASSVTSDYFRFQQKVDYAVGFSVRHKSAAPHTSYQVMSQWHDSLDTGSTFTNSPVVGLYLGESNRDTLRATAIGTSVKDPPSRNYFDAAYSNSSIPFFYDRWVDVVYVFRFDGEGANTWPSDGAAPFTGKIKCYVDGVLQLNKENVVMGNNDAPSRMHYFIFGIYCGWKDEVGKIAFNDPSYGNQNQTVYYDQMRIASGTNATYENVAPSGKITSFVIEQQSGGAWSTIATLPPSIRSHTVTGLSQGSHNFRIKSVSSVTGETSSYATVTGATA